MRVVNAQTCCQPGIYGVNIFSLNILIAKNALCAYCLSRLRDGGRFTIGSNA